MTDRKKLARAHIRAELAKTGGKATKAQLARWGGERSELSPEEVDELVAEAKDQATESKAAPAGGADKE